MSGELKNQINSEANMLPAKEAAKLIGYTSDYVGRLAREQKIFAEQRGRQWFVDVDSLKLFSLQADAERRKRQEKLRQSRIVERAVKQQSETTPEKITSIPNLFLVALAETVAVLACVALVGSLTWTAKNESLDLQAFSFGAVSVSESLSQAFNFLGVFSDEPEIVRAVEPVENQGVVLVDSEADLDKVRESFSDEVVVEMTGDDTGVITPVFKNREDSTEYLFLMVPVYGENTEVEQHVVPNN